MEKEAVFGYPQDVMARGLFASLVWSKE